MKNPDRQPGWENVDLDQEMPLSGVHRETPERSIIFVYLIISTIALPGIAPAIIL